MLPDANGTLRDPNGKYCFSCNGGKTLGEIKTLSFEKYFAWQVEKGGRKTTSVPAAVLRNLVKSQNRNTDTTPTQQNTEHQALLREHAQLPILLTC